MLKLLYLFVPMKVSEARSLDRDVVETGLAFAGFAVSNKSFTHDATPPTPAKKKKKPFLGSVICLSVITFHILVIIKVS
jgi:hypothetical protein